MLSLSAEFAAREVRVLGLGTLEIKNFGFSAQYWLREETTMPLRWIAQRLNMGATGSLANLLRDE
jgi:hypothetical protein